VILRDSAGNVLSGRSVTWSSSQTDIASVDESGLVTGRGPGGPATITATSEGRSGVATIVVTAPNPVPAITKLVPGDATAGGSSLVLRVIGEGFVAGSEVHWNGEIRPTTFVSGTELTSGV